VRELLRHPIYVARIGSGGAAADEVLARPRGQWPSIVRDDTWPAAQAQIERHRKLPRQASQR
jgi:hypothetical protein